VISWYDNEWGYANQIVREAVRIAGTMGRSHRDWSGAGLQESAGAVDTRPEHS